MPWFSNLLSRKLMLDFGVVAALRGVVGMIGTTRIRILHVADTRIYESITVPLAQSAQAGAAFRGCGSGRDA